jgi:single-strand DNA-binding protein
MAGSGINKVILIGNLGVAPEMRYTPGGQAVANFRIATNEKWTDKAGQAQDRTEWHRIVVWGKLAELCNQYLAKGRQVYVEGRLQTREWVDKENHKNYTTEIVAQQVTFLGGRDGAAPGRSAPAGDDFGSPPPELSHGGESGDMMGQGSAAAADDIPF